MDYRLVLFVVVCVGLAGCSGGMDAGAKTGETTGSPTPSMDTISYPDGFSKNGTTAVTDALNTHESQLMDHANYSVQWEFLQWENESLLANTTVGGTVDTIEQRNYFHFEEADATGEVVGYHQDSYLNDGRQLTYSLKTEGLVNDREMNFSSLVFVYNDSIQSQLNSINLDATGVDRHDGMTVITYDVVGVDEQNTDRIEAANGTVRVTENGTIVYWNVRTSFGDEGRTVRYVVSDIGNTTVEQPDWVESVDE